MLLATVLVSIVIRPDWSGGGGRESMEEAELEEETGTWAVGIGDLAGVD